MKVSTKVITLLLVILTSFGLSGSENHSLAQSNKSDKELPKTVTLDCGNGVEMVLTLIPAGTFLMGSPAGGREEVFVDFMKGEFKRRNMGEYDETQHRVTLTKPFHMGIHQVTQAQYEAVMGTNPSSFKSTSNLPVECVSWDDAVEFCKRLSAKTGRNVRLPTEAEWEYACRAGTMSPFHFGETISTDQANYNGNDIYGNGVKGEFRKKTTPVGSFPANAWGLFDMHGNVSEWCADWLGPYDTTQATDPQGATNGTNRVLRGGSWVSIPNLCRSAFRFFCPPDSIMFFCGFRVVTE